VNGPSLPSYTTPLLWSVSSLLLSVDFLQQF